MTGRTRSLFLAQHRDGPGFHDLHLCRYGTGIDKDAVLRFEQAALPDHQLLNGPIDTAVRDSHVLDALFAKIYTQIFEA